MSNIIISLVIFIFHLKVTNNFVINEKQIKVVIRTQNFRPLWPLWDSKEAVPLLLDPQTGEETFICWQAILCPFQVPHQSKYRACCQNGVSHSNIVLVVNHYKACLLSRCHTNHKERLKVSRDSIKIIFIAFNIVLILPISNLLSTPYF